MENGRATPMSSVTTEILETLPAFVWSTSPAGQLDFLSQSILDYTGQSADELRHNASRLIHPDDLDAQRVAHQMRFGSGKPCDYDARILGSDGIYRWFQSRARPLLDASGRLQKWYGIHWEVEERKCTEARLLLRERELLLIGEGVPGMLTVYGPNGSLEYANRRLTDFVGRTAEQMRLAGWSDILHPEDRGSVQQEWRRCVRLGEAMDVTCRLRRADGIHRWFKLRVEPLRTECGEVVRWYGLHIDIDGERRLFDALRGAEKQLAATAKIAALAEMSASIAHEVTQPVAAAIVNAEACLSWLEREPPNMEQAHASARRMVRNGYVAADVVRRTRALFTHDTSDTRAHFYIEDVVCEVLSSLREDLQRHTITVRTSFVQGLSLVRADRVQIRQVVTNLVRNAIDAMSDRADCRQLSISSLAPAPMLVEVEFCDHGSGLEDHERAFEPFYSTKTNGMGLGLPICRAIIEAHGGKLTAAALAAGGTAFRITVPAAPRHLHDQQT